MTPNIVTLSRNRLEIVTIERKEKEVVPPTDYALQSDSQERLFERNRAAAEWVLSVDGTLMELSVDGERTHRVTSEASLPQRPFVINKIGLNDHVLSSGYRVSDDGMRHLSSLTKLKTLVLTLNNVTDDGLAYIASLTTLESLELPKKVTDAGFQHLSGLKSLRYFGVGSARGFTGAGLEHLSNLGQLETLSVPYSGLNDAGLEQCVRFKSLKQLSVSNTKITETGFKYMAQLPNLSRLDIGGNPQLSVESIARLTAMLPKCRIHTNFTDEEIAVAVKELQSESEN